MRLSYPSLFISAFLLVDAATTTTTTTTEKLCLDLTSMVEGATIEVLRLVVKEKGATEEEYVIEVNHIVQVHTFMQSFINSIIHLFNHLFIHWLDNIRSFAKETDCRWQ